MPAQQWKTVTLRGPVRSTGGLAFVIGNDGSENWINPLASHVVSVEDCDPKPIWRIGDIVIDSLYSTYRRVRASSMGDGRSQWRNVASGTLFADDWPRRPLRLLVRDDKAVCE